MNIVIVEDEEMAVRNLTAILNEIGYFNVVATLDSIRESKEWFERNASPDIVFMDIHLADGSAFEIFNLVKINCPIIFTTAYDEYALKAFKVNSIGYLLKPIDIEDVKLAIEKLKNLTRNNFGEEELKKIVSLIKKDSNYKSHLLVPFKNDKLIPLAISDIAYFYIDNSSVKAVTFDEKKLQVDYNLDELYDMLNPIIFFRANRQFIVSRNSIKDIDLWFNNRLSINLKMQIPQQILISKARVTEFKNWLG